MGKKFVFVLILLSFCVSAKAQFHSLGADPASVRWHQIETSHYKVIYPAFADSLARTYAAGLERFYPYEALSSGLTPTKVFKKKFPVILHTYDTNSNGMVVWAPRRMDLLTIPDQGYGRSMSWTTDLTVHESRHLSQMMMGYNNWLKYFRFIFGDGAASVATGLYHKTYWMEGDAVMAETGLTQAGRGRSWNFQQYNIMAWDKGDTRSFARWLFGSNKNNTPNHYAFGYLYLGSIRALYNEPMLTSRYLKQADNPLHLNMNGATILEVTGKREFSPELWKQIVDWNVEEFRKRKDARGPFQKLDTIMVNKSKWYAEYTNSAIVGHYLYAMKESKERAFQFVRIDLRTGEELVLRAFSSTTNCLAYDEYTKKIFWSEHTPTMWDLRVDSRILYYDPEKDSFGYLTDRKHILQNPTPAEGFLVAIEYFHDGSYAVDYIDSTTGEILKTFPVPKGVQPVEAGYLNGYLCMFGVSEEGNSIYEYVDGWKQMFEPLHASGENFMPHDDHFNFASDINGVTEFYSWYPEKNEVYRNTNLPYGGSDFLHEGDSVYFFVPDLRGNHLVKAKCLEERTIIRNIKPDWWIANKITEQEDSLASLEGLKPSSETFGEPFETEISEPKPYRKILHPGKVHTWIPGLYVPYNMGDDVAGSFSNIRVGATAFFQNDLGTSFGHIGWKIAPDVYGTKWRSSAHLDWTYEGILPKIGLSVSFNERSSLNTSRYSAEREVLYPFDKPESQRQNVRLTANGVASSISGKPLITASLNLSVPLVFGSKGRYYRINPRASFSISNDKYDRNIQPYAIEINTIDINRSLIGPDRVQKHTFDYTCSKIISAGLSLSTYTNVPEACYYSRFSASLSLGYTARLGTKDFFSPLAYGSLAMTLPGPSVTGFRVTATYQQPVGNASYFGALIDALPRGFSDYENNALYELGTPTYRLTVDYAIPINLSGADIPGILYFNRINVVPFFDYSSRIVREKWGLNFGSNSL
ncbi:MAG: hypothetical protein HUJ95_06050, partial [Bacteroidales bacterium]|nr:hypothetical protein [Bacteroidales bacterium]